MTNEQILTACRNAGNVGSVSHEEYAHYVIVMTNRKKDGDGWKVVETPYMPVDGRIAMARADHRKQGKKLDFYPPVILANTEEFLTMSL
jgi:hypothetical protein